ncbi:tyrosine-type recombinase/integrase [Streptomyces sp. 8L]|uniref:tyrosine-type recombinase/integrase n=1 Tax=Streptomyces sp. 8L TaxID=2877242 RepID=UPI001CD2B31A|nr:tyrosine-type recombinase/integrase [Streptomyces sp. 8L]MCA1222368.1 tyrosine-type recombinase/integrase [Streptomyces sp. 8L]
MTDSSFEVRIFNLEVRKRSNGTSGFRLLWQVGPRRRFSRTFNTKALADAERAKLLTAAKKGEPFSIETGRPVSYGSKAGEVSWYEFAVGFVDKTWPTNSVNQRKNVAKALMTATVALVRTPLPARFDPVRVRTALREWAFHAKRRGDKAAPPADIREILDWVERNTLSMAAWEDSQLVDRVLGALGTKLDGTAAAPSSVLRNRRIMNLVIELAVRRGVLAKNPLPKGKVSNAAPRVADAIDKRSLLNTDQVQAMLEWIGTRRYGYVYRAFFATLLYAGLRPEEAVALRVADVSLPPEAAVTADGVPEWGEAVVHEAQPEVGSGWTDSGEPHEKRGLKGRPVGDTRTVPLHPDLVALLRAVIERLELQPGDLLFPGQLKGGMLAGSVLRRCWGKARKAVLPPHVFHSIAGQRVYGCRNICLTNWLNDGIPPATVARWAGNSVQVLLAVYARCIDGRDADYQRRAYGTRYIRAS